MASTKTIDARVDLAMKLRKKVHAGKMSKAEARQRWNLVSMAGKSSQPKVMKAAKPAKPMVVKRDSFGPAPATVDQEAARLREMAFGPIKMKVPAPPAESFQSADPLAPNYQPPAGQVQKSQTSSWVNNEAYRNLRVPDALKSANELAAEDSALLRMFEAGLNSSNPAQRGHIEKMLGTYSLDTVKSMVTSRNKADREIASKILRGVNLAAEIPAEKEQGPSIGDLSAAFRATPPAPAGAYYVDNARMG